MEFKPNLFDMPNDHLSETKNYHAHLRLKKACRNQVEINIACLDDLLDKDHQVRQVWKYVESLDLSKCLSNIKSVEGQAGRTKIDPKILVALWLYATIKGITSTYVLNEYTKEHLAFKWLCGGVQIERRTISQFRANNGELFDDLLTQGITVFMRAGIVTLEEVAQDGLRVRASAGRGSFRREYRIDELHEIAEKRVKQLKDELNENPQACRDRQEVNKKKACEEKLQRLEKAKAEFNKFCEDVNKTKKKHKKKLLTDEEKENVKISSTDPEARIMKMPDGGYRPAYNFQYVVDTKKNIVVAANVVNVGSDGGQIGIVYERILNKFGKIKRYLTDGGFKSPEDIEKLTKDGCEAFIPVQTKARGNKEAKDPYKPKTTESEALGKWRIRMGKEESKVIYKRRAATIELLNANLRNWGLYQVTLRGLEKVKGIASMCAVAHNMLRAFSLGLI